MGKKRKLCKSSETVADQVLNKAHKYVESDKKGSNSESRNSDIEIPIQSPKTKKKPKLSKSQKKKLKQEKLDQHNPDHKKDNAIKYLRMWYSDRNNWKFKKSQQSWLINNWKNPKFGDEDFQIFLNYIQGLHRESGAKRKIFEDSDKFVNSETDLFAAERARQIMQSSL